MWSWQLLDARRGVARGNLSLEAAAGTRLDGALLLAAPDAAAGALLPRRGALVPPAASPPQALRPLALACIMLDYLQVRLTVHT